MIAAISIIKKQTNVTLFFSEKLMYNVHRQEHLWTFDSMCAWRRTVMRYNVHRQEHLWTSQGGIKIPMEIERKFTLKTLPEDLSSYPCRHIEQAYLCTEPVIRVRKEDEEYYLTYKGSGMLAREEHNLALTREAYYHLREKADGNIISKRRYLIPLQHPGFKPGFPTPPEDYSLTIELDVFDAPFAPLIMAEVEFGSRDAAEAFLPPDWFDQDVTYRQEYHNSYMAMMQRP